MHLKNLASPLLKSGYGEYLIFLLNENFNMEKINALPFKDHEGLLIEGPLIIQTKILKIQEGFS